MISEAALLAASQCAYKDMQERAVVIQGALDQAMREERRKHSGYGTDGHECRACHFEITPPASAPEKEAP